MSDITVESLQLQVSASSTEAVTSLNALTATLTTIKNVTKGGLGLNAVAKQLTTLNTALNGVSGANADNLNKLAQGLQTLSSCGNLKLSSSVATQITAIGSAVQSINGTNFSALSELATGLGSLSGVGKSNLNSFISQLQRLPQAVQALNSVSMSGLSSKLTELVSALSQLSNMGKNNLTSFVTQLNKIPKLMENLKNVDMRTLYNQIQSLVRVFTPLATQMEKVSAGFAAFPSRIQRLIQTTDNLSASNNRTSKSYVNLAAKLGMAYIAMTRIARVMANMMNQAIEWDGIAQRFSRSFGEYAQDAYSWVKRLNEEMYINTQQFMQYSSIFASMLKGYGIAQKDAATMAVGYTELAYDIWAGYNDIYKSFDDAATAVRATIAGEVEQIRRAGFTIVDSQLALTAANHGVAYSTQSATEEMKSYLRYLTLVDQANAQGLIGTYAREMNTAEGLIRTLKQQIISIAQAFGSVFLPVLAKVLPYVQAFVQLITEAIRAIATLFGVDIQPVNFGAGLGAIGEAAVGAGELEDNLGGAGKEAKKLKDYLLGIDELNVLKPEDNSAGGVGNSGVGGGGVGGFDVGSLWDESIFAEVNRQVGEIVGRIKEWLGLTEKIDTWSEFFHARLGRILTTVGAIALGLAAWKISKSVLNGLSWIAGLKKAGLDKPFMISAGITLAVTGIALEAAGIIDAIRNELDSINFAQILGGGALTILGGALIGKGIAGAVGAALGSGIGAVVAGVPAMFVGIYDACVNGLDWLNAILIPAGGAAAGFGVAAILTAAGTAVAPGIGTLIGLAVGLVVDGIILVIQHWDEISAFLKNFFTVTVPKIWNDFTTWVENIPKALKKFFSSLPTTISEGFDKMWQPIQDYDWNKLGYNIGQWFGNAVKDAIDFVVVAVLPWFATLWDSIKSGFKQFFTVILPKFFTETIPNVVQKIGEFFKELPQKIYAAFVSARKWIVDIGGAIIDGIWEGLQTIWKAITDFVDGFVQGFKDALGIHSPSTVFEEIGKDIVSGLLQGIQGFTNMLSKVAEWAGSVVEWFVKGKDGKGIVENFKEIGENIINGFKDKIGNTYSTVQTNITTWASNVKNWFTSSSFGGINASTFLSYASNIIDSFKDRVSNYYGVAKNAITTFASSVKSWFTGTVSYSSFYSVAADVVQGFKDGIGKLYSSCKSTITTWGTSVIEGFKNKLDSHSPSKVFERIGKDTILGYNLGIAALGNTTKGVVSGWANSFTSVSPVMSFAVDTSALKYYSSDSFAKTVSANVTANSKFAADNPSLIEGFREAVLAALNESDLAGDMRRQADKQEQTVVQVGNRVVTDAVSTQQKANGYRFVTA